jgi:hypothetical protein
LEPYDLSMRSILCSFDGISRLAMNSRTHGVNGCLLDPASRLAIFFEDAIVGNPRPYRDLIHSECRSRLDSLDLRVYPLQPMHLLHAGKLFRGEVRILSNILHRESQY